MGFVLSPGGRTAVRAPLDTDLMLLVIFGAGASYDSVSQSILARISEPDRQEWQPPLAADLFRDRSVFEEVLSRLPQCAALVSDLQRKVAAGASLEQELGIWVAREATEYPPRHRELMALRFYLQETLW